MYFAEEPSVSSQDFFATFVGFILVSIFTLYPHDVLSNGTCSAGVQGRDPSTTQGKETFCKHKQSFHSGGGRVVPKLQLILLTTVCSWIIE